MMHGQGLVHGDLRFMNILCDVKGNVMIVDFDWAGREGEVKYPHNVNTSQIDYHRGLELSVVVTQLT